MDSVAETHQALSHDDYVDRHDTTLSEQQVQSVNEQLKKQQHEHIIHAPQYSDADDGELLVCQWVECGERYGNAEDLYVNAIYDCRGQQVSDHEIEPCLRCPRRT